MTKNMSDKVFMVFDVESVGLHGEGFAVGWCFVDGNGHHIANRHGTDRHGFSNDGEIFACNPNEAKGSSEDREWVQRNIPFDQMSLNCLGPGEVRDQFWQAWCYARDRGALLAADCPWPVEANFLRQCVEDDPSRKWEGPYPLIDVASVLLAAEINPLAKQERLTDELPEHDPYRDARQSARLLITALKKIDYSIMAFKENLERVD
jgi:hypothetical protein